SGDQTWTNRGAGQLMVSGSVGIGSNTLQLSGTSPLVVSGTFRGTGGLFANNTSTLTLSGANTYSGGTTLSAGTLNINNATALGSTSLFTIAGGSIDNTSGTALTLSNNNTQMWSGDFVFKGSDSLNMGSGVVALSANRTVTVIAGTLTEGGAISGGYALTKSGAGRLTLTGDNTYTGATTISAGTLEIGNGGSSGSLSSLGALINNATLIFNLSSTLTQGTDFAPIITGTGSLLQWREHLYRCNAC
ncbi:MAG: hypothetical protein EBR81_16310, partial [Proteobacteria bacterium]|nr:hypothetical protein [Pseudomonadota bacterium]